MYSVVPLLHPRLKTRSVALCPRGRCPWSRSELAFVQSWFPRIKIELFVGIRHQKSVGIRRLSTCLVSLIGTWVGEVHGEEIWQRGFV